MDSSAGCAECELVLLHILRMEKVGLLVEWQTERLGAHPSGTDLRSDPLATNLQVRTDFSQA
jgi:hypothetical protein